MLPRDIEAMGLYVCYSLDDLHEADVVYALRMRTSGRSRPARRSSSAAFSHGAVLREGSLASGTLSSQA